MSAVIVVVDAIVSTMDTAATHRIRPPFRGKVDGTVRCVPSCDDKAQPSRTNFRKWPENITAASGEAQHHSELVAGWADQQSLIGRPDMIDLAQKNRPGAVTNRAALGQHNAAACTRRAR